MQNINLYTELKKPDPYALTLKRAIFIFSAFIVFCFILLFLQLGQIIVSKIALMRSEHAQDVHTQQLEKQLFGDDKAQKRPFQNLAQQTYYQKKMLKKMNAYLDKIPFQPATSLAALANATDPQVWITQIHFDDQGKKIKIQGSTINSEKVPEFEKKINAQFIFKKTVFKVSALMNDEATSQVNFTLNTEEMPNHENH